MGRRRVRDRDGCLGRLGQAGLKSLPKQKSCKPFNPYNRRFVHTTTPDPWIAYRLAINRSPAILDRLVSNDPAAAGALSEQDTMFAQTKS